MKFLKENGVLFLKGVGMGGADIIPGVSGGTIAFITGIYDELLSSIKSVDLAAIKLLLQGDFKRFWIKINGNFLITLLSGILVSLFSLAKAITYLLEHHPIQLWAFFFGLILISSLVVSRDISRWNISVITFYLSGAILAFLITKVVPTETPDNHLLIFISGAIAICAMILPGISGSFILLIFGKYTFILGALEELNIPVILVFILGCITGLFSFSRVISWLLTKYRNITIATLAGFMIGSLNKVWPWKETVETFVDHHGEIKPLLQKNILPNTFQTLGSEPYVLAAVGFFALGIAVVMLVERAARSQKS